MADRKKKTVPLDNDPLWYKDAVIYEIHVKSFCDSDADGIGDFPGLISKLDYLKDLGVTALWLLPFYPSPLRDDGYDIADYYGVHPAYGTLKDFKDFLKEAHSRGMRVITELVLNHTSDKNEWFQRARTSPPGSKQRDFYVWSDTPDKYPDARIIFKDFETSNWAWDPVAKAYYWHRFYSHQPDLNFDSKEVQKAVFEVIDFWLALGVDGLRLDAVPYLYQREGTNCENLPETHEFLKKLRAHVDSKFKNRMLLAEANQWSEEAVKYFGDGDECNMAFNFPVMPRMFMSIQLEDRFPLADILDGAESIPDSSQWALFLRNHDELTLEMVTDEERDLMYRFYAKDNRARINLGIRRRLAPLLWNNQRKIEVMNMLLFSMPGTPVIYYGDEICMGDNFYLGDRDGVRTPMQWSSRRNAGFSEANPQKLFLPVIIDPDYSYETVNVENQEKNLSSMLWWMKRVIAMRKKFKAFGRGSMKQVECANSKVFAFVREFEEQKILVVINLSRFSQSALLGLENYTGFVPEEVFSHNSFPKISADKYSFTLGPYGYFWFELKPDQSVLVSDAGEETAVMETEAGFRGALNAAAEEWLVKNALKKYMIKSRWFRGKSRVVRRLSLIENIRVPEGEEEGAILFIEVVYAEGQPENYILPLFFAWESEAEQIVFNFPAAVIAKVHSPGRHGIMYDGIFSRHLHTKLFSLMKNRGRLKGRYGEVLAEVSRDFEREYAPDEAVFPSYSVGGDQTNTSVLYNGKSVLKFIRALEQGINTEVEIARALTTEADYNSSPPYQAHILYKKYGGNEAYSVSVLQGFVKNEGDGWKYALEHVGKFYERVISRKEELEKSAAESGSSGPSSVPEEEFRSLTGEFFVNMTETLARRTAQMHKALASVANDAAFTPEKMSLLYQRGMFQSMKNGLNAAFRAVDKSIHLLKPEQKEEVKKIYELRDRALSKMKAVADKKFDVSRIRIHGDYHLGQVLFTGNDFMIIDFEGEPARPISERRLKRSPLRDVAGMMRSFHYVAYASLLRHPAIRPEDAEKLSEWAEKWYEYTASVFKKTYLKEAEGAVFIPVSEAETDIMLEAYLVDKALYEIRYEADNRPDWLVIPIKGLRAIIEK